MFKYKPYEKLRLGYKRSIESGHTLLIHLDIRYAKTKNDVTFCYIDYNSGILQGG